MLDPEELAPEAPRLLTRVEFEKLAQTDLFGDDERVELLRGVMVRMTPPPPHPRHEAVIQRLNRILVTRIGERAWVRVNSAYAASSDSEPLPDLFVAPPGDYEDAFPTTAWLVVEVSLSSLRKDRKVKAPLYAENGVPEYWIVDVRGGAIEVYREPRDGVYRAVATYRGGEKIRLVSVPDVEIGVRDVLG